MHVQIYIDIFYISIYIYIFIYIIHVYICYIYIGVCVCVCCVCERNALLAGIMAQESSNFVADPPIPRGNES